MSVPAIYSNRVNPSFNAIDQLETELNDLSAFTHQISGAIPVIEIQDLSNRIFANETAITTLEISNTDLQYDVNQLTALVNALDVSNISGFIVLYDLSFEVWSLSGRFDTYEQQFIDLSSRVLANETSIQILDNSSTSFQSELNTLSGFVYNLTPSADVNQAEFQDLSFYTRTAVQGLANSLSIQGGEIISLQNLTTSIDSTLGTTITRLVDLSLYVETIDPSGVSEVQFNDLSSYTYSSALYTNKTYNNSTFTGTFNQSGSDPLFSCSRLNITGNLTVSGFNIDATGAALDCNSVFTTGLFNQNSINTLYACTGTPSQTFTPTIGEGLPNWFFIDRRPNDATAGTLTIVLPPPSVNYLGTKAKFTLSGSGNSNFQVQVQHSGLFDNYLRFPFVSNQTGQGNQVYMGCVPYNDPVVPIVNAVAIGQPLKGIFAYMWAGRNYDSGLASVYNALHGAVLVFECECGYYDGSPSGVPEFVWFIEPISSSYSPFTTLYPPV
jgi:hypothetical protein